MRKFLNALARDEAGLTMVEYAIAGALISALAAAAFTNLGAAVLAQINILTGFVNG
jgi:pilus assembly protein Flp/PilA